MRLEGFLSLLACLVLLAAFAAGFKSLHDRAQKSVAAVGDSSAR